MLYIYSRNRDFSTLRMRCACVMCTKQFLLCVHVVKLPIVIRLEIDYYYVIPMILPNYKIIVFIIF